MKIATIFCSFISSFIFFQKSVSKYQHQKFYFIIDDLFEMFVKKFTKSNLLHIKNETHSRVILFFFIFIKSKSSHISRLQSIKTNRLFKIRKRQIRKIFNNIRSRNRIASNSFSANDLKNRSFYHTKHRFFFIYLFRKYSAFRYTKCQIFYIQ